MEPNSKRNNQDENTEFIDEMGFQDNSSLKQDHFLSLRKNRRLNNQLKRLNIETPKEKYPLNQNSYNQSSEIIQNFFTAQDKIAFLYEIISNLSNSIQNSNLDTNIVKFIIVQSFNYYEAQKDNINILEKFFTDIIITNLIQVMNLLKQDYLISYNISLLLMKLTFYSFHITKLITLNTNNLTQIFNCLIDENIDVNSNILNLLYNCYYEDEDNVNTKINIGLYVFGKLNNYALELKKCMNKKIKTDENLKILVSFLEILINKKTSNVYRKQFDIGSRNNIIYLLLVLCQDVLEENLKLDSHKALERILSLAEPEDIDVDYNILFCFNDMNTNNVNPKPFYENYKKKNISNILNNLTVTLNNAITLTRFKRYIINKTNIIENLVQCLKIYDLENETINNIYDFFREFVTNKDNCVKLILANFLDIGMIDILKNNIKKKNYEVIKYALDTCLLVLKESSSLTEGKGNVIIMYLEKKGFSEMLTLISGEDFGNNECSQIAKNILDNFLSNENN